MDDAAGVGVSQGQGRLLADAGDADMVMTAI
jgi:hypothetical protein